MDSARTTQTSAGNSAAAHRGIEPSGVAPPQCVASRSGRRPLAANGRAAKTANTPATHAAAAHRAPFFFMRSVTKAPDHFDEIVLAVSEVCRVGHQLPCPFEQLRPLVGGLGDGDAAAAPELQHSLVAQGA